MAKIKVKVKRFSRKSADKHSNGRTDTSKCIILIASWSIKVWFLKDTYHTHDKRLSVRNCSCFLIDPYHIAWTHSGKLRNKREVIIKTLKVTNQKTLWCKATSQKFTCFFKLSIELQTSDYALPWRASDRSRSSWIHQNRVFLTCQAEVKGQGQFGKKGKSQSFCQVRRSIGIPKHFVAKSGKHFFFTSKTVIFLAYLARSVRT